MSIHPLVFMSNKDDVALLSGSETEPDPDYDPVEWAKLPTLPSVSDGVYLWKKNWYPLARKKKAKWLFVCRTRYFDRYCGADCKGHSRESGTYNRVDQWGSSCQEYYGGNGAFTKGNAWVVSGYEACGGCHEDEAMDGRCWVARIVSSLHKWIQ